MTVRSESAECLTISRYSPLAGVELGIEHQLGHADDAVHRGANLVAHVGEEFALGPVGGLGDLPSCAQVVDQPQPDDAQSDLIGNGLQRRDRRRRQRPAHGDREDTLER